ncbi:MAG: biotin synthase BioB [Firmicutes bacterium]|nr:biotin synthase BioB [Bacillota bacterium]
MKKFILDLKEKIFNNEDITHKDAYKLISIDINNFDSINILFNEANNIREKFTGKRVDLCTIINAKSGKCSEDCKYCAQSSFYKTEVNEYDLLNYSTILRRAKEMENKGANRFSLVTSGKGLTSNDFQKLIDIYKNLNKDTNLKLCASHGIITLHQAKALKKAGVSKYHHNLETSENYYPNICTSHTFKDRVKTIENVKKAGLSICSGGIIGLGEGYKDRIDLAFSLKELNIKSVPINILTPIKGTPFEEKTIIKPLEALKTMAVFRFIIPDGYIRYAGGRNALKDKQIQGFLSGVNAALVGNYLTTIGSGIKQDKEMIKKAGLIY